MSPALPNTADSFAEVARVVAALRNGMPFVHFNETCSLQVHVGRGDAGFPLPALQRLVSLLWLGAEELLDMVHPSHRLDNIFCRSLRYESALATNDAITSNPDEPGKGFAAAPASAESWLNFCVRHGGPMDAAEAGKLGAIWRAGSVGDLRDLLVTGLGVEALGMAYKFDHLVGIGTNPGTPDERGRKLTVEFRQADGDLRDGAGYALAWVRVVTALVAFATTTTADDRREFGRVVRKTRGVALALRRSRRLSKARCGRAVAAFLRNIRVPEDAVAVMKRRAERYGGA